MVDVIAVPKDPRFIDRTADFASERKFAVNVNISRVFVLRKKIEDKKAHFLKLKTY